jgi:hypothetical protein
MPHTSDHRTVTLASGARVAVPVRLLEADPEYADLGIESPRFVGLSDEGYLVVQCDGLQYGLTTCCDASAKGGEHGIVCRACYREIDPLLGGPMDVADAYTPEVTA